MPDGACSAEDEYTYARGFEPSHKTHFFTDPSLLERSFDYKPEDEWTESYQPSAIDEAHDLGLCGTLEGGVYLEDSLLSCEDTDEAVNEWELGEDVPGPRFYRRSTGSYEGDEETSVINPSFPAKTSGTENGISYQQKVIRSVLVSDCYCVCYSF